MGRSQAVRQRVLVPRSQVRILAPQPSHRLPVTGPTIAAVVMAGGLGTRMRSAVPKHLHALLGRRMVDWVIEAARPLDPSPLVVVASPETQRRVRRRRGRRSGDARSAPATPCGVARAALGDGAGDAARPLRRHAAAHGGAPGRARSRRIAARVPRRRCSRSSPATPAPTAGSSAAPTAPSRRSSRRPTRRRSSSRSTECNSSIYVFRAERSGPRSTGSSRTTRRASSTSPTPSATSSSAASASPPTSPRTRGDGGRQHARRARSRRGRAPRPDQPGRTCSPASRSSIRVDVDRARGRARARRGRPPVHRPARRHARRHRRRDRRRTRSRRRRDRCRRDRRPVLLPSPWNGPRRHDRRPGRSWRSRSSTIGEGTKVPHLSYIGDAEIGEDTNIGAGAITANFPHQPGLPKGRTTIGRNVRTGVDNVLRCSGRRSATMRGSAAGIGHHGRRPRGRARGFPPRQENKEGRGGQRDD